LNTVLALKSEIVLAVQLTTRHRAPRLAVFLAATLVVMLLVQDPSSVSLDAFRRTVVLIGSALAVVSASRLVAQGGALSSVRRTASPWLLAPAGRLVGVLLLTAVGVFAASSIVLGTRWGIPEALRCASMVLVYCAAIAASAMALTPLTGASAAAAFGLIGALVGGVRPSEVAGLLEGWPLLRGPAVLAWNVLPLPWRAERWLATGGWADPLVLLIWVAFGVVATAYLAGVSIPSAPSDAAS
jgi:hypothetical protein